MRERIALEPFFLVGAFLLEDELCGLGVLKFKSKRNPEMVRAGCQE